MKTEAEDNVERARKELDRLSMSELAVLLATLKSRLGQRCALIEREVRTTLAVAMLTAEPKVGLGEEVLKGLTSPAGCRVKYPAKGDEPKIEIDWKLVIDDARARGMATEAAETPEGRKIIEEAVNIELGQAPGMQGYVIRQKQLRAEKAQEERLREYARKRMETTREGYTFHAWPEDVDFAAIVQRDPDALCIVATFKPPFHEDLQVVLLPQRFLDKFQPGAQVYVAGEPLNPAWGYPQPDLIRRGSAYEVRQAKTNPKPPLDGWRYRCPSPEKIGAIRAEVSAALLYMTEIEKEEERKAREQRDEETERKARQVYVTVERLG